MRPRDVVGRPPANDWERNELEQLLRAKRMSTPMDRLRQIDELNAFSDWLTEQGKSARRLQDIPSPSFGPSPPCSGTP